MADSATDASSILDLLRGIAAVVESLSVEAAADRRQVLQAAKSLEEIRAALAPAGGGHFNTGKVLSTLDLVVQLLRAAEGSCLDSGRRTEVAAALDASLMLASQIARVTAAGRAGEAAQSRQEIDRLPVPAANSAANPTFIIGYRRSGTTLLSWLLDSHPSIASVPENFVCLGLLAAPEFSRWMETARPWLVTAQKSTERLGEPQSRYFRRVADLIDGVFSDYAARQGKRRWVAKELFLHERLDLLDLIFGYSARFIYVFRHGLDAAFSAAQRFAAELGSGGLDVRSYLEEWVRNNEATLDFVECNQRRCHRVRYEDLVLRPEPTARDLLGFLDEPWPPTLFDDMRSQDHHPGLGDPKIFATGGRILTDRLERWKDWPPPLLRQLGRLANPTLERLGYPAVTG